MVVVEALILAAACAMLIGAVAIHHVPSDEGTLVAHAARTMMGGGEIYGVRLATAVRGPAHPHHQDDGRWSRLHLRIPAAGVLLNGTDGAALRLPGRRHPSVAPSLCSSARSDCGCCSRSAGDPGATAVMLGFPFLPDYARLGVSGHHRDGLPHPGRRPLADDRGRRQARSIGHPEGHLPRRSMRHPAAGLVRDAVPARRPLCAAARRRSDTEGAPAGRLIRRHRGGHLAGDRPAVHRRATLRLGRRACSSSSPSTRSRTARG